MFCYGLSLMRKRTLEPHQEKKQNRKVTVCETCTKIFKETVLRRKAKLKGKYI